VAIAGTVGITATGITAADDRGPDAEFKQARNRRACFSFGALIQSSTFHGLSFQGLKV
jgi:hypothetical protein